MSHTGAFHYKVQFAVLKKDEKIAIPIIIMCKMQKDHLHDKAILRNINNILDCMCKAVNHKAGDRIVGIYKIQTVGVDWNITFKDSGRMGSKGGKNYSGVFNEMRKHLSNPKNKIPLSPTFIKHMNKCFTNRDIAKISTKQWDKIVKLLKTGKIKKTKSKVTLQNIATLSKAKAKDKAIKEKKVKREQQKEIKKQRKVFKKDMKSMLWDLVNNAVKESEDKINKQKARADVNDLVKDIIQNSMNIAEANIKKKAVAKKKAMKRKARRKKQKAKKAQEKEVESGTVFFKSLFDKLNTTNLDSGRNNRWGKISHLFENTLFNGAINSQYIQIVGKIDDDAVTFFEWLNETFGGEKSRAVMSEMYNNIKAKLQKIDSHNIPNKLLTRLYFPIEFHTDKPSNKTIFLYWKDGYDEKTFKAWSKLSDAQVGIIFDVLDVEIHLFIKKVYGLWQLEKKMEEYAIEILLKHTLSGLLLGGEPKKELNLVRKALEKKYKGVENSKQVITKTMKTIKELQENQIREDREDDKRIMIEKQEAFDEAQVAVLESIKNAYNLPPDEPLPPDHFLRDLERVILFYKFDRNLSEPQLKRELISEINKKMPTLKTMLGGKSTIIQLITPKVRKALRNYRSYY